MSLRILFVASLHHPEALREAQSGALPGEPRPLFPPSMAQHFWEKALRKRGHTLDVFYRNQPVWGGEAKSQRHSQRITPGKLVKAAVNRIPPEANPELRLRNRKLVEQAQSFKPDVLWLMGDNTVIYPDTLRLIKQETGCKLVYTSGTSPIVFSRPVERRAARLYDLVLVSDYYHGIQWLELGAPRMEVLPLAACDPDFHRPYELTDAERQAFRCDVAFVGTLVPDALYSRRVRALEALRDFDLGIWSVHEVPASLQPFVRGKALGEGMLNVLSAAKIAINVHGDFVHWGGNLRLFEAAGVKVFQIADDLPGVRQWFTDGETIATFSDADDLRRKTTYYLEHEAERLVLVERAQAHVYQNHTYDQRMARAEALIADL